MRILFAGTPDIAVPCLEALAASGHQVAVLTNPDAPAGRGKEWKPSAVKVKALDLGLTVFQPEKLDGTFRATVTNGAPELLVSFAYGKIFGPLFLGLFPFGGLNVHPSLLPRWRGPSPLSAVLLAGDKETGITVQRLAREMDAGDIVVQKTKSLDGSETTASLTGWAAAEAPALLLEAVNQVGLTGGNGPFLSQDPSQATYCKLLTKDEALIDWTLSAGEIHARVRAYNPWPGAFTHYNGVQLILWETKVLPGRGEEALPPGTVVGVDKSEGILVKTGQGLLALRVLQLQSKKSMDFKSFINGAREFVSTRLGVQP